MQTQKVQIWTERAEYIDSVLQLKHEACEKKQKQIEKLDSQVIEEIKRQVGIKRGFINSIRKRVSNPHVYNSSFIQFLFKLKNRMGIKF